MTRVVETTALTAATGAILAASFVGAASAADAQGLRGPIMTPPAKDFWNAFSIGVGGIGTFLNAPTTSSTSYNSQFYNYSLSQSLPLQGSGFGGTIEVGKDFHFAGSGVFGIYANYDFSSAVRGSASTQSTDNYGNPVYLGSAVSVTPTFGVTARAGFLVNPTTLVYGLLGYSQVKYAASVESFDDYFGPISGSSSGTKGAVTVGAGAEMMLTKVLSVKGEYRFTRLGSVTTSSGKGVGGTSTSNIDLHQARLTLQFKLN